MVQVCITIMTDKKIEAPRYENKEDEETRKNRELSNDIRSMLNNELDKRDIDKKKIVYKPFG